MYTESVKLSLRYAIIVFVMYLCYKVTSVEYITTLGTSYSSISQISIGSAFGAFAIILKWHFETKPINNITYDVKSKGEAI